MQKSQKHDSSGMFWFIKAYLGPVFCSFDMHTCFFVHSPHETTAADCSDDS